MIVSAPTAVLLTVCQRLQAVVPSRPNMPVYQNAKAVATAERLTLMATDLEVGLRYSLTDVAIEEPGEAILPLRRLAAILGASPDSEVRLDADGKRIKVTTQSSSYELPTEDPSAFADVTEFDAGGRHYELAAGDLRRMIRRTVFAAAREEGKYAMRSVLWAVDGEKLSLAATDGKRVAVDSGRCTTVRTGKDPGSPLVPPKAMKLLEGLLSDADQAEVVRVSLRLNDALFATERAVIYSRLVEGRFPPYRDVIRTAGKEAKTRVPIVAGQFLAAVRQAAAMADEDCNRLKLAFEPGKVTLRVATAAGSGEVSATLPADGWEGPKAKMDAATVWLADFLQRMDPAAAVRLDVRDEKSGLFGDGNGYQYLVVSMAKDQELG